MAALLACVFLGLSLRIRLLSWRHVPRRFVHVFSYDVNTEMLMRMKILFLAVGLWSLTTGVAVAAPYCAIFPWGKTCDFETYEDCRRAAGSDGGCEFNREPEKAPPATKPFCLVTQSGSQCIYDDAPACRMAAAIHNSRIVTRAECRENPNR
jgi:hypothetical protein